MILNNNQIDALINTGEGLQVEIKACKDALPRSIWETYSAFANTRGGIILLGITEHKDLPAAERFEVTGVDDANKIVTDFFNIINNKQKVSHSVIVDSDVRIARYEGKDIVYINVPEADYRQKPVYINNNIQSGTFKRIHEGDRHVSMEELAMLMRDSTDDVDSQIIPYYGMEDIDAETLRKYRQSFKFENPGHSFETLDDKDFLTRMGGYAVDRQKEEEGVTMAGLLMFGKSIAIHRNFPNFRVDYLDLIDVKPGDSKKWNDRLTDDGRWEDNLYNFLLLAMRKLLFTLPSEGKLHGVVRKDGGVLHEAVREAMINSITYCDYKLGGVLRIDRKTDRIIMRNPGTLRISPERIYNGDYTQARNSTIQRMLRMIGLGDNIGSGFQKILMAWAMLDLPRPDIFEEPEVNEVWLTLPLYDSAKGKEKGKATANIKESNKEKNKESNKENNKESNKENNKEISLPEIPKSVIESLTDVQIQILEAIDKDKFITFKDLGNITGLTQMNLRWQRSKMESSGIYLIRVGSTKSGTWKIEYRGENEVENIETPK